MSDQCFAHGSSFLLDFNADGIYDLGRFLRPYSYTVTDSDNVTHTRRRDAAITIYTSNNSEEKLFQSAGSVGIRYRNFVYGNRYEDRLIFPKMFHGDFDGKGSTEVGYIAENEDSGLTQGVYTSSDGNFTKTPITISFTARDIPNFNRTILVYEIL